MGRTTFLLLLGALLLTLPCAVSATDVFSLSMDTQPAPNAIYAGNTLSFPGVGLGALNTWAATPNGVGRGPQVNFNTALGGGTASIDCSDPRTIMEFDIRVNKQDSTSDVWFLVMQDMSNNWENWGVIYTRPAVAYDGSWTHLTIPLTAKPIMDMAHIRRYEIYTQDTQSHTAGDFCQVRNLRIRLAPGLSGYVYAGAGTSDPVSGATVTIGTKSGVTNASGHYGIGSPPVGTGELVTASHPSYYDGTATIDFSGEADVVQDFHLSPKPMGTITGHVYGGPGTGTPLSGATVKIAGGLTTTTNGSGLYTFSNAPSGTGILVQAISAPAYSQESLTVNLSAGGTVVQDFHMMAHLAASLPFYIPMDQQINYDPAVAPAQNAITSTGTLTFEPVALPDEPDGWSRSHFPGGWRGPNVNFVTAAGAGLDCSDPMTVMEWDLRYYQESPIAGAPITLVMQDTNGNWRNYGLIYSTPAKFPVYPAWAHVTVLLNNSALWPYHDDGPFDPSHVRLLQIYNIGTSDPGPQTDFMDAKKMLIHVVPMMSIGAIKDLPLHSAVNLWFMPVSYTPTSGGSPGSTFYIEQADRAAGIRVENGTSTATPLADKLVTLTGTMEKDGTTGELYVAATTLTTGDGAAVAPLGANTRAIHEDTKLSGELVRVSGTIRELDSSDYQWFKIADGYTKGGAEVLTKITLGIPVGDPSLTGKIAVGDMVKVTGVVSQEDPGTKIILIKSLTRADQMMPSNPPHTISVGFETGEGYATGEIVGQGAGAWTKTTGVASVVASPAPAFGAQSLKFTGEGTINFSTGLAGQSLKYSLVKMHIWRPAGVTNDLTWWGDGTAWFDGGHTNLLETQPIDGSGGAKFPTGGLGRWVELAIMWNFETWEGSSWIDGALLDSKVAMQGNADTTQPDINLIFGAGNGSIYFDDLSFGYALTSDP